MRGLALVKWLAVVLSAVAGVSAQANFDGNPKVKSEIDGVGNRGLLATELNLHPTADGSKGSSSNNPKGRQSQGQYCCCASLTSSCPSSNGGSSNGGGFLDGINPRDSAAKTDPRTAEDIITRIVNNPVSDPQETQCPPGSRTCCYTSRASRDRVRNRCTTLNSGGGNSEFWRQGCTDRGVRGGSARGNQCGERFPVTPDRPLKRGQAKPYEFPWTCLVLNGNNDFLGTCAIIPSNNANDISRGTDRVITAAHKLKKVKPNELIKVRTIEYDASGFNNPETESHREYVVSKFRTHPQYDSRRLSFDVAVLFLNQTLNLRSNRNVNAACLPKCSNMFNHQFSNGTGTRCWVAGWGKDGKDGSFQFIQNKVDVPLVPDRTSCEKALRSALRRQGTGGSDAFTLSDSELCAGGEEGKDACDGDGGAPLVCQADTGRWYVVGLVTWGVGCAQSNVPGVYADIYQMLPWIMSRA